MATIWAKRSAGVGRPGGGVTHVRKGTAYDAGHPVVKAHPDLFADEPPQIAGRRGVERATRAPGEKRTARAPRKPKPKAEAEAGAE